MCSTRASSLKLLWIVTGFCLRRSSVGLRTWSVGALRVVQVMCPDSRNDVVGWSCSTSGQVCHACVPGAQAAGLFSSFLPNVLMLTCCCCLCVRPQLHRRCLCAVSPLPRLSDTAVSGGSEPSTEFVLQRWQKHIHWRRRVYMPPSAQGTLHWVGVVVSTADMMRLCVPEFAGEM